jgi:hypothetical protein
MKRRMKYLLLLSLSAMLVACMDADGYMDKSYANEGDNASSVMDGSFDGEWTVNRQVVDTARLEVKNGVLRVRLPEQYLAQLCWPETNSTPACLGRPVNISLVQQGYSESSQYMSFASPAMNAKQGQALYHSCSFYVANGSEWRIDLLSANCGTAIFRYDTQLWTIGLSVDRVLLTNTVTGQQQERQLYTTIPLYYNAQKRR